MKILLHRLQSIRLVPAQFKGFSLIALLPLLLIVLTMIIAILQQRVPEILDQISAPSPTPTLIAHISPTPFPPTVPATFQPTPISTPTVIHTPTVPATIAPTVPTVNPTNEPSVSVNPPPPQGTGIWISQAEIMSRPTCGAAWNKMRSVADSNIGSSALYNQDSKHPQKTLAVALVAARLGNSATCGGQNCREKAAANIMDIINDGKTEGGGDGRVLGLGRNLAAYIVAADIIDLKTFSPAQHQAFVTFLNSKKRETGHSGACDSLIECHGKRPNNWGTMAGASRIAANLYTGDQAELAEAVKVYRGFIGDRSAYASFQFQSGADSWACNPATKTPVNPVCSKQGVNLSGAVIDDVQRCCSFRTNPQTHYAWGGYSALVAQAEMLHRAGYPAYEWENQAIRRGMTFLQDVMPSSASAPTDWAPYLVNFNYGTNYNTVYPAGDGRLMDWTDWTHRVVAPNNCT